MPAGRPPIYDNPDDLQNAIDGYFADAYKMDPTIQMMVPNPAFIPTITGLCLHCGFESRQSFYAYEDRPEFCYTIKRARMMIEVEYEKRLHGNSNAGAIFALKNFGWTDKQEIDQKTTIEDKRIDATKLTDDELRTLIEIQRKSGVST